LARRGVRKRKQLATVKREDHSYTILYKMLDDVRNISECYKMLYESLHGKMPA
jgi:hypothetical protein